MNELYALEISCPSLASVSVNSAHHERRVSGIRRRLQEPSAHRTSTCPLHTKELGAMQIYFESLSKHGEESSDRLYVW